MDDPIASLRLQAGDTLQLRAVGDAAAPRLTAAMIGYLAGHSLLVTTPRINGKVMLFREGQPLAVHLLAGDRVMGFSTRVLRSCARPFPYLHLAYPESVEQLVIRGARRIPVQMIALVYGEGPGGSGRRLQEVDIVDLSTSGARLAAPRPLAAEGDVMTVVFRFPVGASEQHLRLPARLCNLERQGPAWHHGVEFQAPDPGDILALHGFVYERLAGA